MIRLGIKGRKATVETHQATPEEPAKHRDFAARCERLHIELRPELPENTRTSTLR